MTRRLRLLCEANPMAYGSSSALLAILDPLDAHVTAFVRDVTAELLGADPAVTRAVAVDVKDPRAVAAALDAVDVDAVLVVSNLTNISVYRERGLPIFFVDILYWYGARKDHHVWDDAVATYVQAFPGVTERLAAERHARAPRVVGPLIRPVPAAPNTPGGTLVNLGGVRSRFIGVDASPYVQIVRHLLRDVRAALPPGAIILASGRDAAAQLADGAPSWDARSLTQREYMTRLAGADLLVTAPGLNAVFEGLSRDLPVVFLPPQNATQVLQLARYERAGLVAPGLNLTDLAPTLPAVERVDDEEAYTREVVRALEHLASSPHLLRDVAEHIRAQIRRRDDATLREARRDFWRALGPPGGGAVAADIHQWWAAR